MAISDPITYVYDVGGVGSVTLNRINQDNYGAVYYGVGTNIDVTLTIKHTIPARGKSGESHLVRCDVSRYDATTKALVRTESAWMVIRTDDGVQDQESSEDVAESITAFMSAATITKIVGRQS